MTEEVALIITDFVDADEEGDAIELWNKQVEMYIARWVDKVFFYLCEFVYHE